MAAFKTAIEVTLPKSDAFAYLSDFSKAVEWDPAVNESRSLTEGKPRVGSQYDISTKFAGRAVSLTYEITHFQQNEVVTFQAQNKAVTSIDTLTFEDSPGGTLVTYDANLEGKGIVRFANPLLQKAFNKLGKAADAGLRRQLRDLAASTTDPAIES